MSTLQRTFLSKLSIIKVKEFIFVRCQNMFSPENVVIADLKKRHLKNRCNQSINTVVIVAEASCFPEKIRVNI